MNYCENSEIIPRSFDYWSQETSILDWILHSPRFISWLDTKVHRLVFVFSQRLVLDSVGHRITIGRSRRSDHVQGESIEESKGVEPFLAVTALLMSLCLHVFAEGISVVDFDEAHPFLETLELGSDAG